MVKESANALEGYGKMIRHVWIEAAGEIDFDPKHGSTEVIVELEDGTYWTASFATVSFLHRQMETSRAVARDYSYMPQVRFVAIETPHVFVDSLDEDTIEDTIDNMVTLGVFESAFVPQGDELAILSKVSRTHD